MPPNDRGYGHWRSAGVFPVVERQKEMRAQRLLNARQPANEHRRVLYAAFYFILKSLILVKNFLALRLSSFKLQDFFIAYPPPIAKLVPSTIALVASM